MIGGPASGKALSTASRFGALTAAALLVLSACSEAPAADAATEQPVAAAEPKLKAGACMPIKNGSGCCIFSNGVTSCPSIVGDDDTTTEQPAATASEPAKNEQDRAQ